MNYTMLDATAYADLVIRLISSAEGHESSARDTNDGQITIGYGYTFGRNNNVALWQAADINLTASELANLQAIDSAHPSQKNAIALQQFTRSITHTEAIALLRQTIPGYEGPANQLGMPLSVERAAFVSLSYNRRVVGLERRMQGFFDAVRAGDRAEAWFQFRYMSWGTATQFEAGLRARRLVEADVFGLYDDTPASPSEAKDVYRMFNLHRQEILRLESLWGVNPDATAGTRNLIAEVRADSRWSGFQVGTIVEELEAARIALIDDLKDDYEGLSGTNIDTIAATNIYLDPGRDSTTQSLNPNHPYTLNSTRRDAQGNEIASDDLLIGEGGRDTLIAGLGDDLLIGGAGDDALQGGAGADTYVYHAGDGADTILDLDGLGAIRLNGSVLTGAMCTLTPHPQYRDKRVWRAELGGQEVFIIEWSGDIATGATLRIEGAALGAGGRIEIQDFNNGELGVTLDPTNRLQFEVATASLSEGHALTVPLQLAGPVREGQRVRIAVSALSESLRWAA